MDNLFYEIHSIYNFFLDSNYKPSVAFQLKKTFSVIEKCLKSGNVVKTSLFEVEPKVIMEKIAALDANRFFKMMYPEAAPHLIKTKQSIAAFLDSEVFKNFLSQIDASFTDSEKTLPYASLAGSEKTLLNAAPVATEKPTLVDEKYRVDGNFPVDEELFNRIKHIFKECIICYDNHPVSQEPLIKDYCKYLYRTFCKVSHTKDIAFHTGSILFDIMNIVVASLYCLFTNDLTPMDVLNSLEKNQIVIYNGKRYLYDGYTEKDGKGYFWLKKVTNNERESFLVSKAHNLDLYEGESTELTGIGLSKDVWVNRKAFYHKAFGEKLDNICSITNKSVVIVTPEPIQQVKRVLDRIAIKVDDKMVPLLKIIRASYFTENKETPFVSSYDKNEPNLKFVNSLQLGRMKLLERSGNKNVGLMIFGDEFLAKDESAVKGSINYDAAAFSLVSVTMNYNNKGGLIENNGDAHYFFGSKLHKHVNNNILNVTNINPYTNQLVNQLNAECLHINTPVFVEDVISKETILSIRNTIYEIRHSDYDFAVKDDFIRSSWMLLKLYTNAVFPLSILKDETFLSPHRNRYPLLKDLQKYAASFPEGLKRKADRIILQYSMIENGLLSGTPKQRKLVEILSLVPERISVCIVVPSYYYVDALNQMPVSRYSKNPSGLSITTASRFDNTNHYDLIISAGDIEGDLFDVHYCKASMETKVLLYSDEADRFTQREEQARDKELSFLKYSFFKYPISEKKEEIMTREEKAVIQEDIQKEDEIDAFLRDIEEKHILSPISGYSGSAGAQDSEVTRVVSFETGETAYLTPFYKAYVFGEEKDTMAVKEKKVENLMPGDQMVFTRTSGENRDIVDDIMEYLVQNHRLKESDIVSYEHSLLWKKALVEYSKVNDLRPRDIAKMMKKLGASVTEATIMNWMLPSNGTIGPQKAESILLIGKVTNNDELLHHYNEVFTDCSKVKSIRRGILEKISEIMIKRLNHEPEPESGAAADIYRKISSSAEIYRIAKIIKYQGRYPSFWVNKPI